LSAENILSPPSLFLPREHVFTDTSQCVYFISLIHRTTTYWTNILEQFPSEINHKIIKLQEITLKNVSKTHTNTPHHKLPFKFNSQNHFFPESPTIRHGLSMNFTIFAIFKLDFTNIKYQSLIYQPTQPN
jgi:hypothetical protein